jgi:glycosyltransferase involved in cell wall biosynthesis
VRVLRIITSIDPAVGGPSHSAVNAAIAEQRFGVRTTFVFGQEPDEEARTAPSRRRLAEAGVQVRGFRRIPFARGIAGRWGLSPGLFLWVLRHAGRHDVIHVHYVWALGTLAGVLGGRLHGTPVVMTAHESLTRFDIDGSRSSLRRRQKLRLRHWLLRGVDVVVAASGLELRDSLEPGERGVVIPHPVVDETASDGRETTPAAAGGPIAFLGRLVDKKNVDVLLDALARLPGAARLVVAGTGPDDQRARLEAIAARLGLGDRVEWRGFVGHAGRAELLESCTVVAMPSAYECFGMVAAEAMAAGRPVVVTTNTGVAEIVREHEAGAVVEVGDAGALATAIGRLLDDGASAERAGRHALEAADRHFSFAAYGRAVAALYDDLAQP